MDTCVDTSSYEDELGRHDAGKHADHPFHDEDHHGIMTHTEPRVTFVVRHFRDAGTALVVRAVRPQRGPEFGRG